MWADALLVAERAHLHQLMLWGGASCILGVLLLVTTGGPRRSPIVFHFAAQSGAWVLFAAPLPAVLEVRVVHLRLARAELERDLPGRVQLARALAARIAEAHGGDLSVEDHPPSGAAFVLTLPLDSTRGTPD